MGYPPLRIRNGKDLAELMRRPEFRLLWTADAPDYLPKDAASELITAAYLGAAGSEPK